MAEDRNQPSTHFQSLEGRLDYDTANPSEPTQGQSYYNTSTNRWYIYVGSYWRYAAFTTTTSTSTSTSTTSTSTSTTSTSTSTTSTSTSTTTTTSTSTSTSTSTTTTL